MGLHEKAGTSRVGFVTVPNTSQPTMQKWEISGRKPSGQSLKLLNLIERMGLEAVILVQGTGRIRLPLASICSG